MERKIKLPTSVAGWIFDIIAAFGMKGFVTSFIGFLSTCVAYGFNYLVQRYPEEAVNIATKIQNEWIKASGAWVVFAKNYMEQLTGEEMTVDMMGSLVGHETTLTAQKMSQAIGKEFLHPMLDMILPGTQGWENYRKERGFPINDSKTFDKVIQPSDGVLGAERFLGMNLQFQLQAWMLHFIGDTMSMGTMKSLKDLPNAISWSYGIGWLSWLVMGTPFRVAISDPFQKLLNTIYRSTELTPSQAIDAYNSGYITDTYFWRIMREAGYEEDIIPILLDQGSTKISLASLKDMYQRGRLAPDATTTIKIQNSDDKFLKDNINAANVIMELRRLGYTDGRIAHILFSWRYERHDTLIEKWAAETIDSYEKGITTEDELRKVLTKAGWEDIEQGSPIDIQIEISNMKREQSGQYTKAEIKSLRDNLLISRDDAKAELMRLGYTAARAENLLTLWYPEKAAVKAPKAHILSKSEILSLFNAGIYKEGPAENALIALGYTVTQANNIVETWKGKKATEIEKLEARIAELEAPEEKTLSASEIKSAWTSGFMSLQDVYNGLVDLGYSDNDAMMLTQVYTGATVDQIKGLEEYTPAEAAAKTTKLSKEKIKSLYENGWLDTKEAATRLSEIGYTTSDIPSIMALWTPFTEVTSPEES